MAGYKKKSYKKKAPRRGPKYSRKTSSIVRFGGSKAPAAFRAKTRDQQVSYISTYFEIHHPGTAGAGGEQPNIELNVPCWPSVTNLSVGQNAVVKLGDANESTLDATHPLGFRKLAMLQSMWHLMRVKSVTVKCTLGTTQLEVSDWLFSLYR